MVVVRGHLLCCREEKGERRGEGGNMGGRRIQDLVQVDVGEQDEAEMGQRQENCERQRKKEN